MKTSDFSLIIIIFGIFSGVGAGLFILSHETSDDFDSVGFNHASSNNLGFTSSNHTEVLHKFSSAEELRLFLKDLQTKSSFFVGFYPLINDFLSRKNRWNFPDVLWNLVMVCHY